MASSKGTTFWCFPCPAPQTTPAARRLGRQGTRRMDSRERPRSAARLGAARRDGPRNRTARHQAVGACQHQRRSHSPPGARRRRRHPHRSAQSTRAWQGPHCSPRPEARSQSSAHPARLRAPELILRRRDIPGKAECHRRGPGPAWFNTSPHRRQTSSTWPPPWLKTACVGVGRLAEAAWASTAFRPHRHRRTMANRRSVPATTAYFFRASQSRTSSDAASTPEKVRAISRKSSCARQKIGPPLKFF